MQYSAGTNQRIEGGETFNAHVTADRSFNRYRNGL